MDSDTAAFSRFRRQHSSALPLTPKISSDPSSSRGGEKSGRFARGYICRQCVHPRCPELRAGAPRRKSTQQRRGKPAARRAPPCDRLRCCHCGSGTVSRYFHWRRLGLSRSVKLPAWTLVARRGYRYRRTTARSGRQSTWGTRTHKNGSRDLAALPPFIIVAPPLF
ncbi:hypothetical protein VFPFJ_07143 [Purpureocillium lilacinum]|uniref:Uncharacterized protein n=1 Tax=Purpureocillium lilacinum TaxID=33203 RepID=A0A179GRK9_PURLI|nr:hypothetical protein VFPFJ_07143 [Purpureocillium lilacinum]OAQ79921.1 hypothetical protein VFPBJ_05506 [Purpureocillium lilacinum]OAQ88678.1 hypothetical protein VFPFJ_07143 [Purpureocillium lilacinum]